MFSSKCMSLAFVLSTLVCSLVLADNDLYYTKSKLLVNIFHDYDKTSRPSTKVGSPVNVTLGIAVTQIVKVDEKAEGMHLNVWYRMKWKDCRLAWDYKKYKNVTKLMINSDYLWTPDIILYKPLTSDAGQVLGTTKDEHDLSWKISVGSDGTAFFNFPGIINGQCPLNIANYPFDEHKCSFRFSSWVHDESEINLALKENNPMDFDSYVLNNEWHILGSNYENVAMKYECCPNMYKTVVFHINVRRGASSYISNYIIPSILIIILSLMMFILPPEVGKRMEIGINLLLCLSVYLTILNTKMPTRSDVFPLLSKFYGCCIFILTIALLCTCWVVAYYFHDMSGWKIYEMPKIVQIVVLYYLARLLRFPSAPKVYVSDISVDSDNGNKIIDVKRQTEQPEHSAVQNPNVKNETTEVEHKKRIRESPEDEPKNEKHDNSFTDETLKVKKDIKDKEKRGILGKKNKTDVTENHEKIKDRKKPRKESNEENHVKKEGVKTEKPESVEMNVMEKKHKDAKDNPVLNNGILKDKKKVSLSNNENQTTKDKITSDDKVRAENKKSSGGNTPKESKNETSKKTNHVFANTISSGLVETTRKPTRKPRNRNKNTEDVGIVNKGADKKDVVQKETTNIVVEKEHGGEAEEQQSVRQAPLLQDNKDDVAKPEILIVPKKNDEGDEEVDYCNFDHKTTDDLDFKQRKKKKRHESIKWLSELAEFCADDLQRKKNRFQWRKAAIVLNRLFTIVLLFSITFSIFVVFFTRS